MSNLSIMERIDKYIQETGKVGLKDGIRWRPVYTEEDEEIRNLFKEIMEKEGLETYIDSVGNLFGQLRDEDNKRTEKKILIGSHMDTVKNGGAYDGAVGIIIGIIALTEAIKLYGKPKVPVEIAALIEEEGSRYNMGYVGSRSIVKGLTEKELSAKDEKGILLKEAMLSCGFDPKKAKDSKRDDIKAYLEVHIEQGPVLNSEKKKIGIVEKITGLNVIEVSIEGREDHAGTTPMDLRKDALVESSRIIYKIPKIASNISKTGRATVGMVKVLPGSSNVVPKEVKFTVDIRDIDPVHINRITDEIKKEITKAEEKGFKVYISTEAEENPVILDEDIIRISEKSAKNLNIPYLKMNSGAGHDAQIFAENFPAGLIFIPCKEGRSHTPDEFASIEDISIGVDLMTDIIKNTAY